MFICTTIFFLCFFVVSRYELLFGVTSADAAFAFNNRQLEYGLEPEERNRIFSEFVSTNYGLHQREIFASIVNEYTDWQSAAQHPVNIRDKTLEALNDAHYVAPLVETGDYHSSLNARSWFYVFDYKTKIATTNRYIFVTAASMLTAKTRFWYWFLKLYSFVFNLHLIKLHREALHLVTFHQTIIMKPGTMYILHS